MADTTPFAALVGDRFQFLVDDFGFRQAPFEDLQIQDLWPLAETVTYLGPVGVRATWEPLEDFVEVGAYVLVGGSFPMVAPVTALNVEWIVRARAPDKFQAYIDMHRQHPNRIDAYLDAAAGDLRLLASDFLRGDPRLVEEVRSAMRSAMPGRGVPGVDWWAAADSEVVT